MTSQLYVVEETGVPGENNRLTPSHWQLSHMPSPVGYWLGKQNMATITNHSWSYSITCQKKFLLTIRINHTKTSYWNASAKSGGGGLEQPPTAPGWASDYCHNILIWKITHEITQLFHWHIFNFMFLILLGK